MRHYYVKRDTTVVDTLDLVTERMSDNIVFDIYKNKPDAFINSLNHFNGFPSEVYETIFAIKGGSVDISVEDTYLEVFGKKHKIGYQYGINNLFMVVFDNIVICEAQFLSSSLMDCYLRLSNIYAKDNRLILTFICGGFSFKFNVVIDYNENHVYISDRIYADNVLKDNSKMQRKNIKMELIDSFLGKKFADIKYYAGIRSFDNACMDLDPQWWLGYLMKCKYSDKLVDDAMKSLVLYMRYSRDSFSDYLPDYLDELTSIYGDKLNKYKGQITQLLFLERK